MAKPARRQAVEQPSKRTQVSQSDFPAYALREAMRVPQALHEHLAGGPSAPHDVAMAISLSPTGSQWRMLAGCALAYGLTTGGYNADRIALTDLGRRIVSPLREGDNMSAAVEAALKPRILREFFQRYDRNKFPREDIAKNVLHQMGIPRDRLDDALKSLIENGKDYGLIRETRTGLFVALERAQSVIGAEDSDSDSDAEGVADNILTLPLEPASQKRLGNDRVFISHGKNRKILEQLKTVISYGNFEPVVSIENETVSKPLSDKVLDDMRSCAFAVIHVDTESTLLDSDGNPHVYLNQNVLIEIGAALALHRNHFVLLVKEGVQLPSNLQGLYQCKYSGDTLDFDATMRLLKAFNEFRGKAAA